MAGIYRQRHPERTVFYRVLFHYFDECVAEYENRFEREYGYFRPVIQEVVEKYLDCGNPKCGFARIRCRDCRINLHPHLHFLVSEGGSDREGRFHSVCRFNDDLLRELFTWEVFSLLVHKQLINLTLVQKILRWKHTGGTWTIHESILL